MQENVQCTFIGTSATVPYILPYFYGTTCLQFVAQVIFVQYVTPFSLGTVKENSAQKPDRLPCSSCPDDTAGMRLPPVWKERRNVCTFFEHICYTTAGGRYNEEQAAADSKHKLS